MDYIRKYQIELSREDENFRFCRVGELKSVYYKDKDGELIMFSGHCSLLKNSEYKGYCNLCTSFYKNRGFWLSENGYTVEFVPLYNSEGQMILVQYDRDEIHAHVQSDASNNSERKEHNCFISIQKYGGFAGFSEFD